MVSSNLAYYEGGCQDKASSKKTWDMAENTGCVEQGECNAAYLATTNGAFSKPGKANAVPDSVMARFMKGPVANGMTFDGKVCKNVTSNNLSGALNVLPSLWAFGISWIASIAVLCRSL